VLNSRSGSCIKHSYTQATAVLSFNIREVSLGRLMSRRARSDLERGERGCCDKRAEEDGPSGNRCCHTYLRDRGLLKGTSAASQDGKRVSEQRQVHYRLAARLNEMTYIQSNMNLIQDA
jgi:hypothetical protein